VDRLRRLARVDGDRGERRHEATAVEHLLDDGQDGLVNRDRLEDLAAREQVVDANGAEALEDVFARGDALLSLDAREVHLQGVEQIDLDRVAHDRVAVARDPLHVRGGGSGVRHTRIMGP
jgi:hypothetical protein